MDKLIAFDLPGFKETIAGYSASNSGSSNSDDENNTGANELNKPKWLNQNNGYTINGVGTEGVAPTNENSTSIDFSQPLIPQTSVKLLYHPYANLIEKAILRYGVDGLLAPQKYADDISGLIRQGEHTSFNLVNFYNADSNLIVNPELEENIDFSASGAYSQYNWELFFHIPLFIANTLSNNGKHDEAMKWYHYIFNPASSDPKIVTGTADEETGPQKYWRFRPFYEFYEYNNITDLYTLFTDETRQAELEAQIELMETDPFNPHIIAQFRIVAYMKSVVMKYLDNLIAWGDKLYARDTMESINEATQLFLLAARILGTKPQKVDGLEPNEIAFGDVDWVAFGNALVEVEQILAQIEIAYPVWTNGQSRRTENQVRQAVKMTSSGMLASPRITSNVDQLYFCIQPNDKLLGYWNTVTDRLFKIRHCMNLKGIVRTLPMFEPSIDPGVLIKANAAGIDLSTALDGMFAPMPKYRFRYIYQKATELTNEVKSLGAAILQAIEKRDGEELALIRSGHAIEMSKLMIDIREKTIEETKENIASLEKSLESTEFNRDFYKNRKTRIEKEKRNLDLLESSNVLNASLVAAYAIAGATVLIPDFEAGASGIGPHIVSEIFGGSKTAAVSSYAGQALNQIQSYLQTKASIASVNAGYQRRDEEWGHQKNMADFEITRIKKQIAATELRLAITENELSNLTRQIEQSEEDFEFMTSKFTNKQLYSWMIGQLSNLYNQSYQMALNVAKQAENTYNFELDKKHSFIGYEYWDSLKKGLLAGEKLQRDLHRMDVAFMENNERKNEITKHVSLALIDADSLQDLRDIGTCSFMVPEILFDLDFPGNFNRKIKSVSLTIPGVAGPYTSPTCMLSLQNNWIRKTDEDALEENSFDGKMQFAYSQGHNDNGMFTFNFNDERYLPFEGAGAVSKWKLDLPKSYRQFDYSTISDVILTINYTSEHSDEYALTVNGNIATEINNWLESESSILRAFNFKAEYPNELHKLNNNQQATVKLSLNQFPYFIKSYLDINNTKSLKVYELLFVRKTINTVNDITITDIDSTNTFSGSWSNSSPSIYDSASVTNNPDTNSMFAISLSDQEIELGISATNNDIPDDLLMIVKFKLE